MQDYRKYISSSYTNINPLETRIELEFADILKINNMAH